jgi:hypothetical protein
VVLRSGVIIAIGRVLGETVVFKAEIGEYLNTTEYRSTRSTPLRVQMYSGVRSTSSTIMFISNVLVLGVLCMREQWTKKGILLVLRVLEFYEYAIQLQVETVLNDNRSNYYALTGFGAGRHSYTHPTNPEMFV